jgi:hypothetical protein
MKISLKKLVLGSSFYFYEEPLVPVFKKLIRKVLVLVPHVNGNGNPILVLIWF